MEAIEGISSELNNSSINFNNLSINVNNASINFNDVPIILNNPAIIVNIVNNQSINYSGSSINLNHSSGGNSSSDFNISSDFNSSAINFNTLILEPDNIITKYALSILSLGMVLFAIPLFYSVIWYEKYGTNDLQTIVNQFFSAICWNMIAWNVSVQLITIFRYMTGPINSNICLLTLLTRRTLTTILLLLFDAISLMRYLYIFHLKNIAAFKDDFWYRFVCLWVVGFSLILQFVNTSMPGQKPLGYNVCCGQFPTNEKDIPASLYGMELPSILLQILIYARIKFYKKSSVVPTSATRTQMLTDIDKNSWTSFASNILVVLTVLLLFGISVFGSSLPPHKLVLFPYSLVIRYSALLFPGFLFLFIIGGLFLKNPQMRVCIWREVQNMF